MKSIILKSTIFALTIASLLTVVSCTNDKDYKDSKEVALDSNATKFTTAKEIDAGFLVAAAEINLEEIKLGQLAQNNGSVLLVRELGKMMEEEHTKAFKDLQVLASKKQITIPTTITKNSEEAYDKLKNKFGVDFDNEYCDMMVKGHTNAISKFEKAAVVAQDDEIRTWATTLIISLKIHLAHSTACKDRCANECADKCAAKKTK